MKFLFSALTEYLETKLDANEIGNILTSIGFEIEEIKDLAFPLKDFTVAEIISAEPHPDSKKLKICKVKISDSNQPLQIICGANNARSGIKVAYAKIGAIIPANDMIIKKAKIAGIESSGMLCSMTELNLDSKDNGGIIEIDHSWAVGSAISEVFGLNDAIIEINITPNRGDCLGIYQIAQELAVVGAGKLNKLSIQERKGTYEFPLRVNNQAPEIAPEIHLRHFRNLKNPESPKYIKDRLLASGINPKSALIDITNYVMITLNRPMHAYDASKLSGGFNVNFADDDEGFITLKSDSIKLDSQVLTIRDNKKPIALAGIIGSLDSSCDEDTSEIVLETAYFTPEAISKTGRKYNILSEARHRFERGIDPDNCKMAIDFATDLITDICGGEFSDIKSLQHKIKPKEIELNLGRIFQITGMEVSFKLVDSILTNLGFTVSEMSKNIIKVKVPAHRHDVTCYQDLIEEVTRINGYHKIKSLPFKIKNNATSSPDFLSQAKSYLSNSSCCESINWSFVNSDLEKYFNELQDKLFIDNPISSEINYLRSNLLLGLVNNIKTNIVRGYSSLAFFEVGNIFTAKDLQQDNISIAGVRAGLNKEQNHYLDSREYDVFDVKKDILELIKLYGLKESSIKLDSTNPPKYYHPHRYSKILIGRTVIGQFGEVHPIVNRVFSIKPIINSFELFVNALPKLSPKKNKAFLVNNNQIIERDLAFIVKKEIKAEELIRTALGTDSSLIKDAIIFDIYQGNKISDDKKSLALRLKIQPVDVSLTSHQINQLIDLVTQKVIKAHKAQLRDS